MASKYPAEPKSNDSAEEKTKYKNHVSVFERTIQKSETWIGEMHQDLKWMDADEVYHLLRAVLHSLRDQLSVHEITQFASQLPLLLRGTFYECWSPKDKAPSGLSKEEFLQLVKENLGPITQPKFDMEKGVQVALKVIMKHISHGEMTDVVSTFKPSLKEFFDKIEYH